MTLSLEDRDFYVELCLVAAGYGSKIRVKNFLEDLEELIAAKKKSHSECVRLCVSILKSQAPLSAEDNADLLLAVRDHSRLIPAEEQEMASITELSG